MKQKTKEEREQEEMQGNGKKLREQAWAKEKEGQGEREAVGGDARGGKGCQRSARGVYLYTNKYWGNTAVEINCLRYISIRRKWRGEKVATMGAGENPGV